MAGVIAKPNYDYHDSVSFDLLFHILSCIFQFSQQNAVLMNFSFQLSIFCFVIFENEHENAFQFPNFICNFHFHFSFPFSIFSFQFPFFSFQYPANEIFSVSSFQFPVSSFQFPVSNFQFPVSKKFDPANQ